MDLANQPELTNPKAEAEPARARRGNKRETPDTALVAGAAVAARRDFGEREGKGEEEKILRFEAGMYKKTKDRLT